MSDSKTLSVEELKKKLDADQVDFLFDLRSEDEFESWRIEGRTDVPTLNLPQEAFVGEEERYLEKFPKNKNIVVVCAHGDAAKYAADQLQSRGLNVANLKGGMDAWSELYETHKVTDDPEIYQIYRAARGCLAYLIVSQGVAVAIDAARHIDRIRDLAASLNARINRVFDTHLHADHISGGRELASESGVEYHLHPGDAGDAAISYVPLAGGQRFTFGTCAIDVIHSPGHTPGSTSFLLNNTYLFTGDTIMKTSMGRPDLGGKADEWASLLYDTLFRGYRNLGDKSSLPITLLLPGSRTRAVSSKRPWERPGGRGICIRSATRPHSPCTSKQTCSRTPSGTRRYGRSILGCCGTMRQKGKSWKSARTSAEWRNRTGHGPGKPEQIIWTPMKA
jgi:glyoxylase-like metal-dependent hydrolase (beta-lactamase superfamily II)